MKEFKGVQKDILLSNNNIQLVSAGAGSGKTTVMIEKISNLLLKQNVDIDNLLVVTFTVLAGREMKDRLSQKLKEELAVCVAEEKERILKILEKVDTASIDTIDGFASKVIKKYFYELNISPNIEILSDATKDFYLSRAMRETFDKTDVEELNIMLDIFGGNARNLKPIENLIVTQFNNVMNIEDYEQFFEDVKREYQDALKSEKVLNEHICNCVKICINSITESCVHFGKTVTDKLADFVALLIQFNDKMSFKTNLKLLFELEKPKFTPKEYTENPGLKEVLSEVDNIFDAKKNLIENEINENYEEKNEKILKIALIFIKLLETFIKNYQKIKENNNLIDFNDLNRLILKLLENKNIQAELIDKYKYIFIDEYQDVNPLQDKLMNKLTGENTTIFMVGDVKQSIYGFRGSSPEWFLNKYNSMREKSVGQDVFDMNINFRSSPKILNFINLIFSKLMTKEVADIDYVKDCMIEPKRDDIEDDKVKIWLIKNDKEVEKASGIYSVKNDSAQIANNESCEAMIVAKTITELVGTKFYDANLKQERALTYKDFAILTHSTKDEASKELVEVLRACAIPVNQNNKLDIKQSEVIRLVISILKCVMLTNDDVDTLAMFMALTDLTMDDVAIIRNKEFSFYENLNKFIEKCEKIEENNEKNEENEKNFEILTKILTGFEILSQIEQASFSLTNKELILYILHRQKLRYFILQQTNGEAQLKLLEEFMNQITPMLDSLGLCEFVEVVESNVSSLGEFTLMDAEDSVTLQTIHKSKGLEYPVVFLYNSSKMFSHLREHDAINFNSNLGFGFDYFDTVNRVKTESLTKYAIKLLNNKKGYKEELRLLYVALTRAKNKLFITGTIKNDDFDNIKQTSYANMLIHCFASQLENGGIEKDNFEFKILDSCEFTSINAQNENEDIEDVFGDFVYPFASKFNIPIKNTVTNINKQEIGQVNYSVKDVATRPVQYDIETTAQVGTNYHKALELLDLTKEYEQNSQIDGVDYKKIELAHKTLSGLCKDAIKIKKEAQFEMFVPYNKIVASKITDKVLVQGVVDLIIEKENSIVLVDYKFSKLPARVLKQKYAEQLNLYKLAIEKAYKKQVENMFIYSIVADELI